MFTILLYWNIIAKSVVYQTVYLGIYIWFSVKSFGLTLMCIESVKKCIVTALKAIGHSIHFWAKKGKANRKLGNKLPFGTYLSYLD